MKNRLLILTFLLVVISSGFIFSQQVPQFSQNMFNKLANNPGSAGSSESINTTVLHRSQWMGFDGAPTTLNLAVDAQVNILHGGLGLNIVSDNIAEYSNLGIQLSYAYRAELGSGQLGVGASAGIFQSSLSGGNLIPSTIGDIAIPSGDVTGSAMDFGGGLFYNTRDVYIGLSTLHITEPEIEMTDGVVKSLARHYFLLAGYAHEFNPILSLNPSIYLKSDGSTSQLDVNSTLHYNLENNKMIWGGVSYRLDEGIVFLSGMKLNENLKFGVAYDIVTNQIKNNSLEFMLGYNFDLSPADKIFRSYKNPRYL